MKIISYIKNRLAFTRSTHDYLTHKFIMFEQQRNPEFFAIRLKNDALGFFAQMNWCLFILDFCVRINKKPHLEFVSSNYSDCPEDNWLEYFFEFKQANSAVQGKQRSKKIKCSAIKRIEQLGIKNSLKTVNSAHDIFFRFIRLRPEMQLYVEKFVAREFKGEVVLGAHFRGTDKILEAGRISFDEFASSIKGCLERNPNIRAIFVSSDEKGIFEKIRKHFPNHRIIFHPDSFRSSGSGPVHLKSLASPKQLGFEALANSLILSKCSILVKTASYLSAWSCIFNPNLPVVFLNSLKAQCLWFPETAVYEKSILKN